MKAFIRLFTEFADAVVEFISTTWLTKKSPPSAPLIPIHNHIKFQDVVTFLKLAAERHSPFSNKRPMRTLGGFESCNGKTC